MHVGCKFASIIMSCPKIGLNKLTNRNGNNQDNQSVKIQTTQVTLRFRFCMAGMTRIFEWQRNKIHSIRVFGMLRFTHKNLTLPKNDVYR